MAGNMKKNKGNNWNAQLVRLHRGGVFLFYACGFIFALLECPARAESLPDPTRPPSEFEAPAPAAGGAAVPSGAPLLQSVLISPQHKVAIISGETVTLGGKYHTARVVKISESEVVLNEGGSLQTLKLFPGVEKTMSQIGEATDSTGKKLPRSKRSAAGKENK
jgi:MSHA biogenesis protein MshK